MSRQGATNDTSFLPSSSGEAQAARPGSDGSFFSGASNTSMSDGQFNHVQGDQFVINLNQSSLPQSPVWNRITANDPSISSHRNTPNTLREGLRVPPNFASGQIPVQQSNIIYQRHLELKGHGFPLWIPSANQNLSIQYRRTGVRIGDVGIITPNGGFSFLFNICLPHDDPANSTVLPEDFSPISPPDVDRFLAFGHGYHLASASVEKVQSNSQLSFQFESSASEGAILTMPFGATSESLGNVARFRHYMASNICRWYKFVNGVLGREVKNGDIRLVIGCDKTIAWGIATFANESHQSSCRLSFGPLEVLSSNSISSDSCRYAWGCSGTADAKSGPSPGENDGLRQIDDPGDIVYENQCLFLRTLNPTLSDATWSEINSDLGSVDLQSQSGFLPTEDPAFKSSSASRTANNIMTFDDNSALPSALISHPSSALNGILMAKVPGARMIITQDEDWSLIASKYDTFPDPHELVEQILVSHCICEENGTIFLDRREVEHPHTLIRTSSDQGQWNESKKFEVQVMDISKKVVAASTSISSSNPGPKAPRNPGKSMPWGTPTGRFPMLRNVVVHGGTFIHPSESKVHSDQGQWDESKQLEVQVTDVNKKLVAASTSTSGSKPGPKAPRNLGKSKSLETPTIFPMLQNVFIQGGTFTPTSESRVQFEHHSFITRTGFEILHQNIASGAFPDSGEQFEPVKCHPNTRVAVLAEIMEWIQTIEDSEPVLWLYGSAGGGKSAIAQKFAEMCAELGLLVASFFFSRASQSRNNEKHLVASIAYQLALVIPSTRPYIESAVQNDPVIFERSLHTQIEMLIIRPLEEVYAVDPADAKQWPRLIILDGLDECDDPSIQRTIIYVLSAALPRLTIPILLLVVSRPEPHIRHSFNLLNTSHRSRHIGLDDSYEPDTDIKRFLLSRFHEIKENHQFSTDIPECWPSEGVIDRLVRKSSGQFIYASTVMKYLESPERLPIRQLDVITGLKSVDGDMPYKELDALYSYIFSCVEDLAITLKILGFMFFGTPNRAFTPHFLALLVGLDEDDVHFHLSELHSILYIPPPPNRDGLAIRPTHASLQDFLVDRQRSVKYYFDEEVFHTDVAQQCVRQISMLVVDPGLEDLSDYRQQYFVWSFIHHCIRASTDSADLKNELMQLSDLRPFFATNPLGIGDVPELFEWLYKADGAAKELLSHIQALCDRYLTLTLNQYAFNQRNVDIAGLVFFPPTWHSRWFSLISGSSDVPDIFSRSREEYQDFLTDFFEDKDRSGRYHLDGTVYAHVALECFQNMINSNSDEIFNPYPFVVLGIERPDINLFMSIPEAVTSQREILVPDYRKGLGALTTLLYRAAPSTDLYLYLRNHPLQNPAKAKGHCEHGFYLLRLAVKAYLDRCKHIVPKVLRRSASCPFYHSRVDFDPEFEEHLGTFNERWPLASDRKWPLHLKESRKDGIE